MAKREIITQKPKTPFEDTMDASRATGAQRSNILMYDCTLAAEILAGES